MSSSVVVRRSFAFSLVSLEEQYSVSVLIWRRMDVMRSLTVFVFQWTSFICAFAKSVVSFASERSMLFINNSNRSESICRKYWFLGLTSLSVSVRSVSKEVRSTQMFFASSRVNRPSMTFSESTAQSLRNKESAERILLTLSSNEML